MKLLENKDNYVVIEQYATVYLFSYVTCVAMVDKAGELVINNPSYESDSRTTTRHINKFKADYYKGE